MWAERDRLFQNVCTEVYFESALAMKRCQAGVPLVPLQTEGEWGSPKGAIREVPAIQGPEAKR